MSDSLGPVILDIEGYALTQEDKEILLHPLVGGVIFFSRNYECPEQLSDLVSSIRAVRPELLLSVDQEGGRVQRFKKGMTILPPLRVLGEWMDRENDEPRALEMSELLGWFMALEVRALGVDLSFAPVLDLDKNISEVIRSRGFHSNASTISALGLAYIRGMSKAGMKATGKHFPGHGSVTVDSHLGLPEDPRSFDAINEDIAPFKALIANGLPAIMPAHIVYPNIDPYPVGFSSFWLQEVLRGQCGFEGAIISDDLSMVGAKGMGSCDERAKKALEAGCDFILACNDRLGAVSILDKVSDISHKASLPRRLMMKAKGEIPPLDELKKTPVWQKAFDAVEGLKQVEGSMSE